MVDEATSVTGPCPRCAKHRDAIIALGYDPYCSMCGGSGRVDTRAAWEQISDAVRLNIMLDEIIHLTCLGVAVDGVFHVEIPAEIVELAQDALRRFNGDV
jgi:hypothetical protein